MADDRYHSSDPTGDAVPSPADAAGPAAGDTGRSRDGRASRAGRSVRHVLPGLAVAALIAMAATFLSEHYGGPPMLFALLLGIAFHFLSQEGRCVDGIEVAGKQVLRIGVGLLGARITVEEILALGPAPLLTVAAAVTLTIGFGLVAARLAGLDRRFGVLTGGAVAICGASAALALAAVLPRGRDHERDTLFTVIGVTTLSTVAMIVYPLVVAAFGLDAVEGGIFLGGTIHDVAQVVGAGYSVSETTGDVATFTKLLRVAMLLPAVMLVSLVFRRGAGVAGAEARPPLLPGFLVAFALLVIANSLGLVPDALRHGLEEASRWCLVTAIAALGMKTSLKAMASMGALPIAVIVGETLFLAVLVMAVMLVV